jgi:hypothetical protein
MNAKKGAWMTSRMNLEVSVLSILQSLATKETVDQTLALAYKSN